jgi:hypothetical protein
MTNIDEYKNVQVNGQTVIETNIQYLRSIKLWIYDGTDMSRDYNFRMQALTNANELCGVFLEHLNANLPEQEYESIFIIFVKIMREITKAIRDEEYDFTQPIEAIDYFISILE